MKLFSIDGKLYQVLEQIWQVMELSLLFLLGCLPVVTIGVSATAMFRTRFDMIEEGDVPIMSRFWSAYRRDFGRAVAMWLSVIAGFAALLGAYWGVAALTGGSQYALMPLVVVGAVWMLTCVNVFPLLALRSGQSLPLAVLFREAVSLGLGHVLQSALMACVLLAAALSVMFVPWLLLAAVLFFPGLTCYARAWLVRWACAE
ncbi:YesL family protein [Bifidobacterium amazonense]|uniref:YesL family protein n=1 Tax=Bifidobacterium amazonense TaxID=2809027 RepID=A0ABS9VUY1_9BIFI|nr:YesL family protein [Bifidobacterium amazonense]MCH9275882.1 YesL family protein [Bifidobacterium amazonense]